MGLLREVQPEPSEPSHRELWMGQTCQGSSLGFIAGFPCAKDAMQHKVFATSEPPGDETTIFTKALRHLNTLEILMVSSSLDDRY